MPLHLPVDWSTLSPAVLGIMFQDVMNKDFRRETGAHYTNEENILKVINPLFLEDLWKEFHNVKTTPDRLHKFHDRIASLKFLDPACGCGIFLIVTYGELRKLELELMKAKGGTPVQKVSIEQFYGIEIEEFPCRMAMLGMRLIDHQWNIRVSEEFGQHDTGLQQLQQATVQHTTVAANTNIVQSNALRMDWEDVVPKEELSFILGNPPFGGARTMTPQQKEDIRHVFGNIKSVGNLDYVTAWFKKAAEVMKGTCIQTGFVATNSITQGEQVALLWKPLIERGVQINFAHTAFKWESDTKGKAAVHCVIVGFSCAEGIQKRIYHEEPAFHFSPTPPLSGTFSARKGAVSPSISKSVAAKNICPYLMDAPNVFIESRTQSLCNVPKMFFGSMPNDGGHLLIEADEYQDFLRAEPKVKKFIRRYVGSVEFINNLQRYCLWLVNAAPAELSAMPTVMQRIENVRKHRENSKAEGTRKKAKTAALFFQITQPKTEYILIPRVSSERREYIPIGFMPPKVIASDAALTIPDASLFHFGILTSSVHMAWMRVVGGKLEMSYRYSKNIVYNNFPWASVTDAQKEQIEVLVQKILDVRKKFPDCSLADLYDPLTMPPELLKAHQNLDKTVLKLYKFKQDVSESEMVARLMEMYQQLAEKPTASSS